MDTKAFIFLSYLFTIITLSTISTIISNDLKDKTNNLETKIDSLTTIVFEMKSTIDTTVVTQAKHFSKCSFIANDDVAVGHDGHLYSIDWRRRHGRE